MDLISCTSIAFGSQKGNDVVIDVILRFIGESESFRWPFELLSIFQVKCSHRMNEIFWWMSPNF